MFLISRKHILTTISIYQNVIRSKQWKNQRIWYHFKEDIREGVRNAIREKKSELAR
jgi:hypothetical protein